MFIENFDEMYAKIAEVRERVIQISLESKTAVLMDEFNYQALSLIQDSIDRLRELGVPDDAMTFTMAELAVLSRMRDFDIKIRWVKASGYSNIA